MTIHLRAIRPADEHFRADVRIKRRLLSEATEELLDELDNVHPLLRWPLRPALPERAEPKGFRLCL